MRDDSDCEHTKATTDNRSSIPSIIGSSMDNDLTSLSWLQNAACLLPAISAVPDGGGHDVAAALALSTSSYRERFECRCITRHKY